MGKSVKLYGQLIGGVVGPGGETTGFVLKLPPLDVDSGGHAVSKGPATIAGELVPRSWPLRGKVQILRAREVESAPSHLSRTGLACPVILSGSVRTGVIRPGGETTGTELIGASPDVDLSDLKNFKIADPSGKAVAVTGHFVPKHYVERGLQFVLKATAVEEVIHPETFGFDKTTGAGMTTVRAVGYSESFSFEAALADAISKLPAAELPPDWLSDIKVENIGAEVGGFAGVHRLKVEVSTVRPNA